MDSSAIYAGIAGAPCAGDGSKTCNSCTSVSPKACNQSSVYPTLNFAITFKTKKAVNNAVAILYLESATAGTYNALVTLAAKPYAQGETVTLSTTWSNICNQLGLGTSCSSASDVIYSRGLKFGVGAEASGTVDPATEAKQLTLKFHYIAPSSTATQAICPDNSSGVGACNIAFVPGDEKVYIDKAIYNGNDSVSGVSIDWDAIAIFPIAYSTGSRDAIYTGFANNQASPTFKTINTDGSIPDSQISGLSNYQEYCIVYGTRNKAQNIYKFVTSNTGTTKVSDKGCVTPSQVVGVLDDKHCFISTAAFGSMDAPEVETFRQFRNKFLLPFSVGREFIRLYYEFSPPLANIISGNEYLKATTRLLLYPLLVFAYLSLHVGFLLACLCVLLALSVLLIQKKYMRKRHITVLLLILIITPILKAEVTNKETLIDHPLAEQGLIRIKKDGTYVYKTNEQLKFNNESSSLKVGQANQPDITLQVVTTDSNGNPTGTTNFNFAAFYDTNSGYLIDYNYEKYLFNDVGRLGWQAGISAMFASGHGRLVATPNGPSREAFTFITMPLSLGAVYRLETHDHQMFVPYSAGGGTYVALIEKREDKSTPQFAGGFGFYAAGGILLNLGAFDDDTNYELASEYGIENLWLSLEFKVIEVSNESFGFSNRYLNAGLSFDF